jgi:hypothetical protein
MAEQVKELAGPYEIFELTDGEVRELRIIRYETGDVTIHPLHTTAPKVVTALRVFVPRETKPVGPDYWDITSKTLVAQMLPYLEAWGYRGKVFVVTKYGVAPRARFTLDVKLA